MHQQLLHRLLLGLSLWGLGLMGMAQTPIVEQYVTIGLAQNLALKRQDYAYEKSVQALREAKGLYYPQVTFSAAYTVALGGRAIQLPIGDLLNPVYTTLNQLTETNQFPQVENVDEQFLPNNFQETKIRIIQPIYNTDIYLNRQIKEDMQMSNAAARDAYRQELTRDIRTSYYAYLQSCEVLDIYDQTAGLLQEVLRVNQSLVANQKATAEVVAQAQADISQLAQDRALAVQQQQSARAYVNFLLNRPLQTEIEVDSLIMQAAQTPISLEGLQSQALTQRYELSQLDYAKTASEKAVELQRMQQYPTVNLVVDAGFQGFGYNFGEQGFVLANAMVSWNVFQGFQNKAQIQQAEIDLASVQNQREEVVQQVQLQVEQAYYGLQAAKARVKAAEDGLKSATQSFNLVQKRYQTQQTNFLTLVDARTRYTQAQLNLVIARYAYLGQQAELAYAAGK